MIIRSGRDKGILPDPIDFSHVYDNLQMWTRKTNKVKCVDVGNFRRYDTKKNSKFSGKGKFSMEEGIELPFEKHVKEKLVVAVLHYLCYTIPGLDMTALEGFWTSDKLGDDSPISKAVEGSH